VRALTVAIYEGADGVATIQTLKNRGYRLLIPVRPFAPGNATAVAPPAIPANAGCSATQRS